MIREKDGGLEIENLSISYWVGGKELPALRGITLSVPKGRTIGIVGESGSGKSTLAYAMLGYLAPNATLRTGRVLFDGVDLVRASQTELQRIRGARIAMVPQDAYGSLNPSIRIGDQLVEVLTQHTRLNRGDTCRQAVESLALVQMPDPSRYARLYSHQLSGGMQQRVLIAMALCTEPAVLVMDEPTSNLDATTEASILDLLRGLRGRIEAGIVYVSHNLGVIAGLADHVCVMYGGELVEEGSTEELFFKPAHPYTVALFDCLPIRAGHKQRGALAGIPGSVPSLGALPPGCIFAPRCQMGRAECISRMPPWHEVTPGHSTRCMYWHDVVARISNASDEAAVSAEEIVPQSKEVVLRAEEIRKHYPLASKALSWATPRSARALDGVTLEVRHGETVGVVGESGCGKTTLLRCVAGLTDISSGKLEFLGEDIARPCGRRPVRVLQQLQMVFQNPDNTLNPKRTIGGILARSLRILGRLPGRQIPEQVRELLIRVQLNPDYVSRFPHELSGGERQRVAIARAFTGRSRLVLCDEPLSALDVSVQASVLQLLLNLQEKHGVSYLLISHDLSVIRYAADVIAVIYLGQLCEVGPAGAFWRPPHHPYTEALLSAQPIPDPRRQPARVRLEGVVPSSIDPPSGCPFNTRCPRKVGGICEEEAPPWREAGGGQLIRCHIAPAELAFAQSAAQRGH